MGHTRATFKPGDSDGSGAKNLPTSRLSLVERAAQPLSAQASSLQTHRYTSLEEPTAITSALGA